MSRVRGGRRAVTLAAALAVLVAGCAGPSEPGPLAARPYLVAIDPVEPVPSSEVSGRLVTEGDCVLVEDDRGLVLPLFTARTAFGPLEGGGLTIDVAGERVAIGDEVTFRGGVVDDPAALRSRYPGVDLQRCSTGRYALVGELTGRGAAGP